MRKSKHREILDQVLARQQITKPRRRPGQEEHLLQVACVQWFYGQHRNLYGLLYAVPNGGRRDQVTGAKLKAEGVVAGVSDLNLDIARHGFHGLRIELKTPTGRQSQRQRWWQSQVEAQGFKYIVVRDILEFIDQVNSYLQED
jgi:hypothetical protein